MSKQNTQAGKANTTPAAASAKAGTAQGPQDSAGKVLQTGKGHVVAPGHSFQTKNGTIGAGTSVTAAEFKTAKDPTGKTEFQRQLDKGSIVAGRAARGTPEGEKAAGGVIDGGGATGAGPSGAQVTAAEAGDEGAQKVVDAALSGTEADLAAANGANPDGTAADTAKE